VNPRHYAIAVGQRFVRGLRRDSGGFNRLEYTGQAIGQLIVRGLTAKHGFVPKRRSIGGLI
jgi:hypothetical protein